MEAVVLAMAALTPWAFGGVDPVFELLLAVGLAVLLLLWAGLAVADGKFTFVRSPVALVLALIFVVGVVQLVPLPTFVLRVISPGAAEIRDELLPSQPEKLTPDVAVPAPGLPTISVYPHATRTELFRWLAALILFAAVRNQIASTASLWRLSLVMLINGSLLALFGLVQAFSSTARDPDTGQALVFWAHKSVAPFGPFLNRNHFAAFINLCLALGIGLLLWLEPTPEARQQRYMMKANALEQQQEVFDVLLRPFAVLHSPQQLWTLVSLGIMFASLVCSLSRGGLAVFFIALIITVCLRLSWPIRIRRLEVVIVPALIVLAVFAWLGFRPLETRLSTLLKGNESAAATRLPMWADLVRLVPRFWLLGSGYGTLGYVEPLTRRPTTFPDPAMFVDHAHNDYLEALVEGGIARAGLTLLLVGLVFVAGFRGLRRYTGRTPGSLAFGAMTGFLAIALHSAIDFSITTPAVGILTVIVVAQLVAINRADPTTHPGDDYVGVDSLEMTPIRRVIVPVTAALLGAIFVVHAWQADHVHRLQLAAFAAVHEDPPEYGSALVYLNAAVAADPTDADLQVDLGQEYLNAGRSERASAVKHARARRFIADGRPTFAGALCLAATADSAASAVGDILVWENPPVAQGKTVDLFRQYTVPALEHMAAARGQCQLLARPQMRFAAHATEVLRADPPGDYWFRALKLARFDPDLWYFAGRQALRDGHLDEAWRHWRTSLQLATEPVYPEQFAKHADRIREMVTAALPYLGSDRRRAAELLREEVLPDRPEDLYEAATILDPSLSPTGAARPLLDRALSILGSHVESLGAADQHLRAKIYMALDDSDGAIRAYARAVELAPSHLQTAWRLEFVRLLMEQRKWKEANRELQFLFPRMPDSPQIKEWMRLVKRQLEIDTDR
jgi:O-antigen ligase